MGTVTIGSYTTSTIDTGGSFDPCADEEVVIQGVSRASRVSAVVETEIVYDSFAGGIWEYDEDGNIINPSEVLTPRYISNVPEYDSPTMISLRAVSSHTELLGCNTDVGVRPEQDAIRDDSYYLEKEVSSWTLEGYMAEPRARMATAEHEKKIYNFGGSSPRFNEITREWDTTVLDEFWYFDTETGGAVVLNNGGITPRTLAYARVVNGVFYMMGGFEVDFNANSYIDEFWAYDIDAGTWSQKSVPSVGWRSAQLTYADGQIRMNFANEPVVLHFYNFLNESWSYDIGTNTWTLVWDGGEWGAEVYHSLDGQVYHKGQFYFWNEGRLINIVTSEEIITDGVALNGVQDSAGTVSYGDYVIFHAGLDIPTFEGSTDVWWFNTINRYYGKIDVSGIVPRVNHSISQVVIGDKLWVLGGHTYEYQFGELVNIPDSKIYSLDLKQFFDTLDTCGAVPVPPDTITVELGWGCMETATHPCPPPPTYKTIEYIPPE